MSEPTITERREPSGAKGVPPEDHEKEFQRLADQWRGETGHLSYLPQKYRHGAYQRILAMGERAVPLILRSLKEKGGWWFDALAALTNEDPARKNKRDIRYSVVDSLPIGGRHQLRPIKTRTSRANLRSYTPLL